MPEKNIALNKNVSSHLKPINLDWIDYVLFDQVGLSVSLLM